MGGKSSKMPQQISVENSMQQQYNYEQRYDNDPAFKQREDARLRRQSREQQQQDIHAADEKIKQSRYIGSSSYFGSTDNKVKFEVDASILKPVVFQEENVSQTKKVPATQFNFFFVRHAKSCANEQKGLLNLKKLELDDPFISNDGIFATFAKQEEYNEFFAKIGIIDHYFCSPSIRTWCTGGMLFLKFISEFEIAPHLREDAWFNYSNHPYPYGTNVERFRFFAEYVKTLTDGNVIIDGVPGYALMNKALSSYGSDFVKQVGIELFMQWYIKNENILGRTNKSIRNVVVVCHSELLKNFCNAHLNESQLSERGMGGGDAFFKHTNNYCIQVQVKMPIREFKREPVYAPLTSSESNEVKQSVEKHMADALKEYDEMMKRAEAAAANAAAVSDNAVSIESAGGNKHKKTKKKITRSKPKRHNKKTRVSKQRGGGNKYLDAIVTNLPFAITITKAAIDGTTDIARHSRAKTKDCICYPDAYQSPNRTFLCAKSGPDDARGFLTRQSSAKLASAENQVDSAN